MRQLILFPITVSVALSGCAGFQAEDQPRNTLSGEVVTLSEWNYEEIYQEGGIRSSELMGAQVFGPDNREIGNVENLLISRDNQLVGLIAEIGGFADIGDTHVVVPWEEVSLMDKGVKVPVSPGNISEYGLFSNKSPLASKELKQTVRIDDDAGTGDQTWKLTSLIGDYATRQGGAGYGYVDEVLFSKEGQIQAVVIEAGGYPYAYPFHGEPFGWRPGLNAYPLLYGPDQTGAQGPFDYNRYGY
jgi:sporulation protein YlmC with PRC-barrel domain